MIYWSFVRELIETDLVWSTIDLVQIGVSPIGNVVIDCDRSRTKVVETPVLMLASIPTMRRSMMTIGCRLSHRLFDYDCCCQCHMYLGDGVHCTHSMGGRRILHLYDHWRSWPSSWSNDHNGKQKTIEDRRKRNKNCVRSTVKIAVNRYFPAKFN